MSKLSTEAAEKTGEQAVNYCATKSDFIICYKNSNYVQSSCQ